MWGCSVTFPLLNVCITCWVENIDSRERFALSHPFLLHMCEVTVMTILNCLMTIGMLMIKEMLWHTLRSWNRSNLFFA